MQNADVFGGFCRASSQQQTLQGGDVFHDKIRRGKGEPDTFGMRFVVLHRVRADTDHSWVSAKRVTQLSEAFGVSL